MVAVSQQADALEICDEPFGACRAKFYIRFGPQDTNLNYIFLFVYFDFFAAIRALPSNIGKT